MIYVEKTNMGSLRIFRDSLQLRAWLGAPVVSTPLGELGVELDVAEIERDFEGDPVKPVHDLLLTREETNELIRVALSGPPGPPGPAGVSFNTPLA